MTGDAVTNDSQKYPEPALSENGFCEPNWYFTDSVRLCLILL